MMPAILCLTVLLTSIRLLAADSLPIPRFTDSNRRARLEKSFPEIDKVLADYYRQRGVPGLVYGIVIDGELAHVRTFGVANRTTNQPVTPDTVFRIASMTKSFTALSILKLRDEGKLSLEDPASKWIPELGVLKYPTRDSAPVRIRELLTHGAGFPEDNPWGDQQLATSDDLLSRWLKTGIPFSTAPDTSYEYSNYGFALLGRIVSAASGMPYRQYLEKNILAPLGMRASTLEPSAVPASVRAIGYRKTGDAYSEEPSLAHGAFGSMGGLHVSARDLARYVAFMLSAFPPRDAEDSGPVRRSSVREMQRLWRADGFSAEWTPARVRAVSGGYGYGLSVTRTCDFSQIVAHGGGLPGYGSYMVWLPEYGVGLFAMANLTYSGPGGVLIRALDLLRDTGGLERRELPPAAELTATRDTIVRLWNSWDSQRAAEMAAMNLFLDTPEAARRKQIETMKSEVGECRDPGELKPENWLRGRFRMPCERGFVDVTFTLAPTIPPKVQYLQFSRALPLTARMKSAAEGLASLSPDRISDSDSLRDRIDILRREHGTCRLGDTLAGDGRSNARVRLDCDRGSVEVQFAVNEEGKLTDVSFPRPPGVTCGP